MTDMSEKDRQAENLHGGLAGQSVLLDKKALNKAKSEAIYKTRIKKSGGKKIAFGLFLLIGLVALFFVSVTSIFIGGANISFVQVLEAIFKYDSGIFNHQVVMQHRMPRVVANILVGAALAVTGAIMQGSTKNPIADSGLMGISSGSILAICMSMAFIPAVTSLQMMLYAAIGAAVATFITYFIAAAGKRGMTPERLVLAGMSISTLFGSISTGIAIKFGLSRSLAYWVAGGTADADWQKLAIAAPFFLVGTIIAICLSRSITVLGLGDDVAVSLGINKRLVKILSTVVILLLTGMAVVIIGPVGYVGLIVPHVVRYFTGVDYRYIVPASAVFGALFVVLADLFGKLIFGAYVMPIGVIFSLIGVPFFIYISRKQKREFE